MPYRLPRSSVLLATKFLFHAALLLALLFPASSALAAAAYESNPTAATASSLEAEASLATVPLSHSAAPANAEPHTTPARLPLASSNAEARDHRHLEHYSWHKPAPPMLPPSPSPPGSSVFDLFLNSSRVALDETLARAANWASSAAAWVEAGLSTAAGSDSSCSGTSLVLLGHKIFCSDDAAGAAVSAVRFRRRALCPPARQLRADAVLTARWSPRVVALLQVVIPGVLKIVNWTASEVSSRRVWHAHTVTCSTLCDSLA